MASDQASVQVPLQDWRNDGRPGRYQQNTMVPYATVEVTTERPKDHIIWSLCCFVNGNLFCLGLAALIFSIKARDRKVVGDMEGARHYGSTACSLNIAATVLAVIGYLIALIIIIRMFYVYNYYRNYGYYN